jgi:hypothetical protein
MTNETVKIKISVRTQKVGSECSETIEFEREDWDQMSEKTKDETLRDCLWDSGMVDWDWEET